MNPELNAQKPFCVVELATNAPKRFMVVRLVGSIGDITLLREQDAGPLENADAVRKCQAWNESKPMSPFFDL